MQDKKDLSSVMAKFVFIILKLEKLRCPLGKRTGNVGKILSIT
jgi:hypothetical protein